MKKPHALIIASLVVFASAFILVSFPSAKAGDAVFNAQALAGTTSSVTSLTAYIDRFASDRMFIAVTFLHTLTCPTGSQTSFSISDNSTAKAFVRAGCKTFGASGVGSDEIWYYNTTGLSTSFNKLVYSWSGSALYMQFQVSSWSSVNTAVTPTYANGGSSVSSCSSETALDPTFSELSTETIVAYSVLLTCGAGTYPSSVTGTGALAHEIQGFAGCSLPGGTCMNTAYIQTGGTGISFGIPASPTKYWEVSYIRFAGVVNVPPTVNTNPANDIRLDQASIHGNATSFGDCASPTPVPTLGFYYGTHGHVTDNNVTSGAVSLFFDENYTIHDLTPGLEYDFQAWVTCRYESSGLQITLGGILSFTTITPPGIQTQAADAIADNGAMLHGDVTSAGDCVGSESVGFFFGFHGHVTDNNDTVSNGFPPHFQYFPSLISGVQYDFQAWGLCRLVNGQTGFSIAAILNFTTLRKIPTVITNDPQSDFFNSSNFILSGTITDMGNATYLNVGFLYSLNASMTNATNVTAGFRMTTGSFSYSIPGLSPGVTVYVRAWVNGNLTREYALGSIKSGTTASIQFDIFGVIWLIVFFSILCVGVVGASSIRRYRGGGRGSKGHRGSFGGEGQ